MIVSVRGAQMLRCRATRRSQLNPQLQRIAPHFMTLGSTPRHLCVPVRKNNQAIPPAILNIVRSIDLERFPASTDVIIPPVNVSLQHLNPLLANQPHIPVVLQDAASLLVPVAKNGVIPPNN